jgi:hypothetical protein
MWRRQLEDSQGYVEGTERSGLPKTHRYDDNIDRRRKVVCSDNAKQSPQACCVEISRSHVEMLAQKVLNLVPPIASDIMTTTHIPCASTLKHFEARIFQLEQSEPLLNNVRTGPGAHPASHTMGTGSLSRR